MFRSTTLSLLSPGRLAVIASLLALVIAMSFPANAQQPPAASPATQPIVEAEQAQGQATDSQEPDVDAESQGQEQGEEAEEPEPEPLPHPALVIGSTIDGNTSNNAHANYSFRAASPGLLTVVVRSKSRGTDLAMQLYGADGSSMNNGYCDIDFNGDTGAEHFTLLIPGAGVYRLEVQPLGSGGAFWIGASWIAYEGAAAAMPAKPSEATDLTPGTAQTCNINGQNPPNAWFKYTTEVEGFMLVETSAPGDPDLVMEMYIEAQGFQDAMEYSDQDRRGNVSNEQISVELQPGQTVYIKIRDHGSGVPAEVRVRCRLFLEEDQE